MIEIENFLDFPENIIDYAKEANFVDGESPYDGIVYPLICKDIPEKILYDAMYNLTYKAMGRMPKDPVCFMRRSPEGQPVPHRYHTDNSMGAYSMMLYLEDNPDAGTGFARHEETGLTTAPVTAASLNKTIKDCNDDSKWQIYKVAEMVKNKAVIFDSHLFHVALPIGGFGKGKESRTVFTCFFS